jgi:hypothetical protein
MPDLIYCRLPVTEDLIAEDMALDWAIVDSLSARPDDEETDGGPVSRFNNFI